jgi:TATA-binding protein-associated factor Taf7
MKKRHLVQSSKIAGFVTNDVKCDFDLSGILIEILKNNLLEKIIITINNEIYARILVSFTKVFRFTNTRMREHCVIDHLPNEVCLLFTSYASILHDQRLSLGTGHGPS